MLRLFPLAIALTLLTSPFASAQQRRKIIINEDCSGPGGSNMQALAILIQSPQVEVLGVTVVSGDQWRDEEVMHTLRLLELLGRTDIPVMYGAAFPLVRTRVETKLWQERYGRVAYAGAWDDRWWHEASAVPPLPEGQPKIKPSEENAIHFLLRTVHQYPHEVTIYEGGPATNLALAISIDPHFPEMAKELVLMGGSLSPITTNPEFTNSPRHEFNFWFDPEAAHIVLRAPWKKIICTPVDISVKTALTRALVNKIDTAGTPLAHYIARYFSSEGGNDIMWDEIAAAAWLDPSLITKRETRYMGVDIDHGANYGNTLTWTNKDDVKIAVQLVEIQVDLDTEKFYALFAKLMSVPPAH